MVDKVKREQWKEFMEELQSESDRSCAILGAAFLDEQLGALLEAFMVDDPKMIKELFEGATAPLSTFSGRTQISYALGFLTKEEVKDINIIRRIRNDFAHDLHGVNFSTPAVKSRCKELTQLKYIESEKRFKIQEYFKDASPRERYVLRVTFLAQHIALRRLGIGDSRRVVEAGFKTTGTKSHK